MSQSFPVPIGGVPMPRDFAPSILFAALYGVLALIGIYRFVRRESRNVFVFSSLAFVIERVVIWSLRAIQAHTPAEATSRGLTVYWQISFGVGYLASFDRVLAFLRCLAVSTTRGAAAPPETHELEAVSPVPPAYDPTASPDAGKDLTQDEKRSALVRWLCVEKCGPAEQVDDPKRRQNYRTIFGLVALLGLLPVVVGPIAGNMYADGETDPGKASTVRVLRYLTAGVALLLIQIIHVSCAWLIYTVPRVDRFAVALLFTVITILQLIPTYQLVIIGNSTTSLTSTARGSQNTGGEKAAFYVLQALPEFIVSAALLVVNSKTLFQTGTWGDPISDTSRTWWRRSRARAQEPEAAAS